MTNGYVSAYDATTLAELSGGAWSTTFPLSNMLSLDLGDDAVARTLYPTESSTCWKAVFPPGTAMRVAAMINHDIVGLDPGVFVPSLPQSRIRTIRKIGGGSLGATFNPKSRPVAILASTNLSGSISLLQEPDPEQSSSHLTASNPAADTDIRVSMQGATCGLLTGAGLQPLRIYALNTGLGAATLTVEVWLNGVQKWVSSAIGSISPLGQLLTITWDASVLGGSPPPADGVQIRLRGTAAGGSTIVPGSIEWLPEYVSNADATVVDLGWEEVVLPPNFWTPPKALDNLYHVREFPAGTSCDEMFVEFKGVLNDGVFMTVGKFWAGDAQVFVDPHGVETDEEAGTLRITRKDPSYVDDSLSSLDVERSKTYRLVEASYAAIDEDTNEWVESQLDRYCGVTRPALWRFRPEPEMDHRTTLLAVQRDILGSVPLVTSIPAFSRAFSLREWV